LERSFFSSVSLACSRGFPFVAVLPLRFFSFFFPPGTFFFPHSPVVFFSRDLWPGLPFFGPLLKHNRDPTLPIVRQPTPFSPKTHFGFVASFFPTTKRAPISLPRPPAPECWVRRVASWSFFFQQTPSQTRRWLIFLYFLTAVIFDDLLPVTGRSQLPLSFAVCWDFPPFDQQACPGSFPTKVPFHFVLHGSSPFFLSLSAVSEASLVFPPFIRSSKELFLFFPFLSKATGLCENAPVLVLVLFCVRTVS